MIVERDPGALNAFKRKGCLFANRGPLERMKRLIREVKEFVKRCPPLTRPFRSTSR